MKKALSLILVFMMCLSVCACSGGNNDTPTSTPELTSTPSTQPTQNITTSEPTTPMLPAVPTETTEPIITPEQCSHTYKDATCSAPKTCSKCGATDGSVADHDYYESICTVCGDIDPNAPNLTADFERIMDYLKAKQANDESVTSSDVAKALGLEKRYVEHIFDSVFCRKGLGIITPAEVKLPDGTRRQEKFLSLTPAGIDYTP